MELLEDCSSCSQQKGRGRERFFRYIVRPECNGIGVKRLEPQADTSVNLEWRLRIRGVYIHSPKTFMSKCSGIWENLYFSLLITE